MSENQGLIASHISVTRDDGHVLVDDVSIHAEAGRTLVIVGESGAGKSMLARTICALTPHTLSAQGQVTLGGREFDIVRQARAFKALRGKGIVWLPQDPFTSLSPTQRCGTQIIADTRLPKRARDERVRERLREVGLPERVAQAYPQELSGGMRQRVAIAAALDSSPGVFIADEPTTALDVTTQKEILDLLSELSESRSMALILITHDLALAREYGDEVVVMRHGKVVESGSVEKVFTHPESDYTRQLAAAEPRLDGPNPRSFTEESQTDHSLDAASEKKHVAPALVEARDLVKIFRGRSRRDHHVAVDGVSLSIAHQESVGIVGESGSGKTTLARLIIGLEKPDSGSIEGNGTLREKLQGALEGGQPPMGIVFQNPYSALNPARTIGATLAEALHVGGRSASEVPSLLESVGLPASYTNRFPARLSGGERQRVAIARALATRPQLLICDEAVSALDVSVQASVLELLLQLQRQQGFALLFITHDLAVARQMCDRLVVMKDGHIVEEGATEDILHSPTQEYTRVLLAAVPGQESDNG